jgi:hypothetical protein
MQQSVGTQQTMGTQQAIGMQQVDVTQHVGLLQLSGDTACILLLLFIEFVTVEHQPLHTNGRRQLQKDARNQPYAD